MAPKWTPKSSKHGAEIVPNTIQNVIEIAVVFLSEMHFLINSHAFNDFQDSKVDFGSLGGHFACLGYRLGCILGLLGCPWDLFWGSNGNLVRLWRAVVAKGRLPLSRSPLFERFWLPKGAQKGPKMELKSFRKRFKM